MRATPPAGSAVSHDGLSRAPIGSRSFLASENSTQLAGWVGRPRVVRLATSLVPPFHGQMPIEQAIGPELVLLRINLARVKSRVSLM